jgi:hypothetical protein
MGTMKTAESKISGESAIKKCSFFGKEGGEGFFSQPARHSSLFFSKAPTHPNDIQPRLSVGEPDGDREPPKEKIRKKPIFESDAESPDDDNNTLHKKGTVEHPSSSQTVSPGVESKLASTKGSGASLPDSSRHQMESAFGADFSDVRIHNDTDAAQMNNDLNAHAFTYGKDIYFGTGKYDSSGQSGRHLLAHELTHVVQQDKSSNNTIQREPETPNEKISRLINDGDNKGIADLKDDELAVSTSAQRAGMIKILIDSYWMSENEERASVRILTYGGQSAQVLAFIGAINYTDKLLKSIGIEELHRQLIDEIAKANVQQHGGDEAIAKILVNPDSSYKDVMKIGSFSGASNTQRLGLLKIMLDTWSSSAEEQGKIVDILESSGGGLSGLMIDIKALGLKQKLFDHISEDNNKIRFTKVIGALHDPGLDADLKVFNRGFFGNLWEGIKGGVVSAWDNFSIGAIIMSLLQPIIHPIDTLLSLFDQLGEFFKNPSWEGLFKFCRDLFGTVAIWLLELAGISFLVGLAVSAGVITLPAGIVIEAITAALFSLSTKFGLIFIGFAILKTVTDAIQAGASTTQRELQKKQERLGQDFTLLAVIGILWTIVKGIGKFITKFRGGAADPKLADPEKLKETSQEGKKAEDGTKDNAKKLNDEANSRKDVEQPGKQAGSTGAFGKVLSILGEKARLVIEKAFGDGSAFDALVGKIKNITLPTLEIVNSIRSYFEKMGYADAPENQVMLRRMEAIAKGEMAPEPVDIDFMQHELLERGLVDKGIEKGYVDVPGQSQVWDPAHDITRVSLGVDNVYHPDAIKAGEAEGN